MTLRLMAVVALVSSPLAALADGGSASPTPTSTPSGPIAIQSCDVTKAYSGYGLGALTINGKGYNFFKVGFTNQGKVAADQIKFQIDFGSSRIVIGDTGSYAPGTSVTHTYRDHGTDVVPSARPGGSGPTVCSVVSVHFADGTTWTAPAPAPTSP